MRKFLALLAFIASPALAQQPNGTINSPIYATGYISQVGGTNVTTTIKAQPNHPANQNVYLTSAVTGTWTIQLPNPSFEGQVLSFNCGSSAATISVMSSDGSSLDSSIPTSCIANLGFTLQFDQRSNIWRNLGSAATTNIGIINVDAFGAVGDINTPIDDTTHIQNALNAMSAAGGGIVKLNPAKSYYTASTITIPKKVTLTCDGPGQDIYQTPFNYTAKTCAIYSGVTGTNAAIALNGELKGTMILQYRVHTSGNPSSRAAGLALVAGFTGVGVAIGDGTNPGPANNTHMDRVTIGGFTTCINTNFSSQDRKFHVFMDCTNGYNLKDSHDNDKNDHLEAWEFLTTNRAGTNSQWDISAIADNGSGLWRVTTATAHDLATGDTVSIINGIGGQGIVGRWTITVIDPTHFDLQGSIVTPTATATTTNLSNYVTVSSTNKLRRGMSVTGTGIPAGTFIAGVWKTRNAISLTQAATASGTPTLTFDSTAYTAASTKAIVNTNYRSGFAFKIDNSEGFVCNECMEFGYESPFVLNNAVGTSWVNAQLDGTYLRGTENSIGVEFSGYSYDNYMQFATFAAGMYGVVADGSVTAGFPNFVIAPRMYVQGVLAEVNSTGSDISIIGGGQDNDSNFLVDNSRTLTIEGNFNAARVFSTISPPTWYGSAKLSQATNAYYPRLRSSNRYQSSTTATVDVWRDNSQGTDAKVWRWNNPNSQFSLQLLNDAENTAVTAFTCLRSGMTPTQCVFGAPIQLPSTPSLSDNSTNAATTAYVDRLRTKITTFSASGTFTPSAGVVAARVIAFGAGGGGGGGPRVAAATGASGGGGGGGGSRVAGTFSAVQLGASVSVTVGSGGTAGAAAAADNTAGAAGGVGGNTTFGSLLTAFGGGGGAGGSASTASGGGGGAGLSAGASGSGGTGGGSGFGGTSGGSGIASSASTTDSSGTGGGGTSNVGVASSSGSASQSSTGGGAGGGFDAANVAKNGAAAGSVLVSGKTLSGGTAGVAGGTVAGGVGGAGGSSSSYEQPGSGGGGGAANTTAAGAGGGGGLAGGAGGGGGAAQNGGVAGAGGVGGAGLLIVIEYF